jgi:hypothetical protein
MKAAQSQKPQAADLAAGPNKGPNCWDCRHLMITWDVRTPYGCKLMGFRSKYIPSIEVLRTDGRFCSGFTAKPLPMPANTPKPKPTLAVGKTTKRRNTDPSRAFAPINLII